LAAISEFVIKHLNIALFLQVDRFIMMALETTTDMGHITRNQSTMRVDLTQWKSTDEADLKDDLRSSIQRTI
jgi:hypothetical protein